MRIAEELKRQGVSPSLLRRVEDFVAAQTASEEVSAPLFIYYGKEVWEDAISALLAGENLLLVGPKATGKNVLAENLATLFGRPHRTISFHVNSDAATLLGSDTFRNGEVTFRPGPIYDMAVRGGFGILDEINMARNDAVAVLHATLDFRRVIDLPGYDAIRLSPATRFIATMNEGYLGTRELNEALTSRFMVIHVPAIDRASLQHLLAEQFPTLKEEYQNTFAHLFAALHQKSAQAEISTKSVDLRGLLGAIRLMQNGLSPARALDMGLTNKTFDPFEKDLVRDVIALHISPSLEAEQVFLDSFPVTHASPETTPEKGPASELSK